MRKDDLKTSDSNDTPSNSWNLDSTKKNSSCT